MAYFYAIGGEKGSPAMRTSVAYFGLGDVDTIDELVVRWLDGSETIVTDLPVNRTITVTHPSRLPAAR